MEAIILGTSSAVPTFRRGLSGTVLMREGETLLFDCGEGTQFRMIAAEIPRRKFHHIFVTHLHGDHIFGLGGLISSLNLAQREYPLTVHGPRGLERFVRFMIDFPRPGRLGFEVTVQEYPQRFAGVVLETDAYRVITQPLEHTVPTFGYRFQEKDRPGKFDEARSEELGIPFGPLRGDLVRGKTIVLEDGREVRPEEVVGPPQPGRAVAYCTDTAFCPAAIELARGADLLIHEATYGDELEDMARARKHATIRQAATVARDAGVARFVATHFSTRYDGPLLRQLAAEGREVYPDLIMAKDLIRIPL